MLIALQIFFGTIENSIFNSITSHMANNKFLASAAIMKKILASKFIHIFESETSNL